MAASVETAGSSSIFSPQEILKEVRTFIHGANYKVQNLRQRENLSQSALILLRTLPTARAAVLEYTAGVFDEAVNAYLLEMEVGHSVNDGSSQAMDRYLHDVCGILHSFIQANHAAWAPIISAWSLELLGHLSRKYADRRGVPRGSLNELLQLWLTCTPTKLLIDVATQCFSQMATATTASYVDALLEASVKYTPHFDWVVAHIGSAFPQAIITRVLMCGLKDYSCHGNQGDGEGMEGKIPKMASVVGILGHLAAQHGVDIRDALLKLFQESLDGTPGQGQAPVLGFLLQLASMSPVLLHILANNLIPRLNAQVLNRLHTQLQPWAASRPGEFKSLMTLVVHLIIQNETSADSLLNFLISNSTPSAELLPSEATSPLPEINNICAFLIEEVLRETQTQVYRRGRLEMGMSLPYLGALGSHIHTLTKEMLDTGDNRGKWLQRLVCYIILYKGQKVGAEILAYILTIAKTHGQLSQLVRIQREVETGLPGVLDACVCHTLDLLHYKKDTDKHTLLTNLHTLTHWESTAGDNLVRCSFKSCLVDHWSSLTPLLLHDDLDITHLTLDILNQVAITTELDSGAGLKAVGSLVTVFFRVLKMEDQKQAGPLVEGCKKFARKLARQPHTQTMLVRYIVEACVDYENKPLLGGKHELEVCRSGTRDASVSLREENTKHGLSLTTLRSHSSVFHAGVIGQGLRHAQSQQILDQAIISCNQLYVEELLWVCCHDYQAPRPQSPTPGQEEQKSVKAHRLVMSADLCRTLGSMITELATPDVLYNNRFWPEEESLKMTVERDLHVWGYFDDNPILYRIMLMLAGNTLVMARCSPVLKSLTATMLHYFDVTREKLPTNSPKQLACVNCVIRCLGKSGLLPAPLSYLSELLPLVKSYEVCLLLLAVWRYMKETPPTEDPSDVAHRVCEPRHLTVVRSVLHNNIDQTGDVYARFFGDLVTDDLAGEVRSMDTTDIH
ncbi:integrator complex subunit 5-like [Mya arenaria]|uniref:integrator complex subunit 5-like n=1 Tax=Mya arenaria TaxID=6604 RepID=UPI0022E71014|nr:integrator complex subunit 5-like [Mya arenaria]